MCALQLLVVIRDPEYDKAQVYNSDPDVFDPQILSQFFELDGENKRKSQKIQYFTDTDYQKFKNDKDPESEDNEEENISVQDPKKTASKLPRQMCKTD